MKCLLSVLAIQTIGGHRTVSMMNKKFLAVALFLTYRLFIFFFFQKFQL